MEEVSSDLKQFKSLNPNRKAAVFGIIFIVFVVSILVGGMLSKSKNAQKDAANMEAAEGETTLSMRSAVSKLKVGQTTTVEVVLDKTPVQAVDIFISYDPKVLKVSDIKNGDIFPSIIKSDITENSLYATSVVDYDKPNDLKTGTVLSFTVQALAPSKETVLDFIPKKTVTAKNGVTTLGLAEKLMLTVDR